MSKTKFLLSAALILGTFPAAFGVVANGTAQAAVINTIFVEDFSDAVLAAQLTNRNGTPIAGGIADLNGSNANNTAQGFTFDITPYNVFNNPAQTGGPTVSWIMEANVRNPVTTGSLDTLLGWNGHIGLRLVNPGQWQIHNGAGGLTATVTAPSAGDHVALVFTDNGTTDRLDYYVNGVLNNSIAFNAVFAASQLGSYGLETHLGAPIARGFDGSFDAIAFSTFTGTFGPNDRFALLAPEPSTSLIWLVALVGLAIYAQRRSR